MDRPRAGRIRWCGRRTGWSPRVMTAPGRRRPAAPTRRPAAASVSAWSCWRRSPPAAVCARRRCGRGSPSRPAIRCGRRRWSTMRAGCGWTARRGRCRTCATRRWGTSWSRRRRPACAWHWSRTGAPAPTSRAAVAALLARAAARRRHPSWRHLLLRHRRRSARCTSSQPLRAVLPDARLFALCGNHDVYGGGRGYYGLLREIGQPASYFCLRSPDQLLADPRRRHRAARPRPDRRRRWPSPSARARWRKPWHADKLRGFPGLRRCS